MAKRDHSVKVLGFAGGLQKNSYDREDLRAAWDSLPLGMMLEIFDLTPMPMFNEYVESVKYPAVVLELNRHVAAADAPLIATPE